MLQIQSQSVLSHLSVDQYCIHIVWCNLELENRRLNSIAKDPEGLDSDLSMGSAEKQCLQTTRVCDVVEIRQSRMATGTSRPPARDVRDTVDPPRGFDQSAMLTSYRVWD